MGEKYFGGYDIGVLVMKSWVPKPPGHISCASNYDFPIYYYPVENTSSKNVHNGEHDIIPNIMDAVKQLQDIGCKAIVSSCGYFGHYQKIISSMANVPVYLSAVCLIPFIFKLLGKDKELAVICYNKEKLTPELFEACGVNESLLQRCCIYDVIGETELGKIVTDCGQYNIEKAKQEIGEIARKVLIEHKNTGAFLLECTDLPPHAHVIQEITSLPVFDATTMVKFVHELTMNQKRRILLLTVAGQSTRFRESGGGYFKVPLLSQPCGAIPAISDATSK